MADDRSKRGPPGRKQINVDEPYEVKSWCAKFGCTKAELITARATVGPMAGEIEKYLKDQKKR